MQNRKKEIKSQNMDALNEYIIELRSNPRLAYLFIELTDRCNLACLHCGSSCEQTQGRFIDTQMLFHALETVAADFPSDSVMICLTGGEPMLHPDFYAIVQKVVQLGFEWGMTTNGTLITPDAAQKLKNLHLKSVTISIDGLEKTHDWLRNVSGCFQRTIASVHNLHSVGIPVQVTTVIHKKNFSELEAIFDFMCSIGVNSWRVVNLEPIGRALQNRDLLLSDKEFRELLDFIREKRFSIHTPMEVMFGCSHYLSFEYEHEVRDNYFLCGSGIYVGSILCNGDIYSCLDIERRPELIQGNIASDRFSDVWFHRFKEFRTNRSALSEQCSHCAEKDFCRGDSAHTWDFAKNEPMFCILRKEN